MSARHYLYRNLFAFAIALGLLPGSTFTAHPLAAQRREQPQRTRPSANERGPRAIAVIEWQTDARGRATPKLIPVVILDGGHLYDASLYRATPVPMALEPGTVYEAQDAGEILGYFTVKNAAHSNARSSADSESSANDRAWIGIGDWKTASPALDGYSNRPQHAEIVRPRAGSTNGPDLADNQGSSDSSGSNSSTKEQATVYDEQGREISPDPNNSRPTLKRRNSKDKEGTPRIAPADSSKAKTSTAEDDPDRPRLKRSTTSSGSGSPDSDSGSSTSSSSSESGAASSADQGIASNQDTTGRATTSPNNSAPGDGSASNAGSDPDRPVLRHGKGGEQVTTDSNANADPDRPVLKRGGGDPRGSAGQASRNRTGGDNNGAINKKPSSMKAASGANVPQRVIDRGTRQMDATSAVALRTRAYEAAAVSDARIVENAPVYRHRWQDNEEAGVTRKMTALAEAELANLSTGANRVASEQRRPPPAGQSAAQSKAQRRRGTNATSRSSQTTAVPDLAAAKWDDVRVTALDLSSNNSSEMVFTARRKQAGNRYTYITLVARMDLDGNPRKLFSQVTTSGRLDSVPRLEFIDAVDADGDGRAELLFRAVRGSDSEFVIYRVGPDKLTEIFHGGEAS